METAGNECKRSLIRRSPSSNSSFRLRCNSLNSLRLRRIFDLFDKNSDGIISVDEISQALNLLGLDAETSELDSMVNSYIQSGNAGLRFEDFEALHQSLNDFFFGLDDTLEETISEEEDEGEAGGSKQTKASREESDLTEAFKVFDVDGDGYISARELQVVLRKLGFPEGIEFDSVEKMISSVDRDQDGRVDFFEFKDMMRSVVVRTG